jgi:hypothetical protein
MTEPLFETASLSALSPADLAVLEWARDSGLRVTYHADLLAGPSYSVCCPAERLAEMRQVRAAAVRRLN